MGLAENARGAQAEGSRRAEDELGAEIGVGTGFGAGIVIDIPVTLPPAAPQPEPHSPRIELVRRVGVQRPELHGDHQRRRNRHPEGSRCDGGRDHEPSGRHGAPREPALLGERQSRWHGKRDVDERRPEPGEPQARHVGEVVGAEQRGDADLPLLDVVDQRIVEVARIHDVGLPPGDLLDADAYVGAMEVQIGIALVHLDGRRAVLEGVVEVVQSGVPALEGTARARAELQVRMERARQRPVQPEIEEGLRALARASPRVSDRPPVEVAADGEATVAPGHLERGGGTGKEARTQGDERDSVEPT